MGQSSSTPFMSIRDGHQRRVSFDTKEEFGDKIDKLGGDDRQINNKR